MHVWALVLFVGLSLAISCRVASADSGAAIYRDLCATCHGDKGQGVEGLHDGPLAGDASLTELTQRIVETMPEDDPEACVGEDAAAVAQFVFDEFYSLEAQQRRGLVAAPRVELVRLTEHQYRNALADLLLRLTDGGEKHWGTIEGAQRGLFAEYYESDGMNKASEKKLERVDGRVDFDFGEEAPDESIAADQFLIVWRGSFFARHTGDYAFRIRTENGARLYFNHVDGSGQGKLRDDSSRDEAERLIDLWVGSGKMREQTKHVYLLGGRRYPLRLAFFKYKDPAASIHFEWKQPGGAWSVVEGDVLSPESAPPVFVAEAPFPPDDRSAGFARGSDVSPAWVSAVSQMALETADEVVARLAPLKVKAKELPADVAAAAEFVQRFTSLAYRRPLTPSEQGQIGSPFRKPADATETAPSTETLLRRGVLHALMSPDFLYVNLPADNSNSNFQRATRLALALWDSIPDKALQQAAERGELQTREQVVAQAERMLADPRAAAKMRRFFNSWLELEGREVVKDDQAFPEFNEQVVADLRESLERFIEQVVWSERSDYRELLLSDRLLLNDRLAKIYGDSAGNSDGEGDAASDFRSIEAAAEHRAGILTHPYLLSVFAYHDNTSPIHRGVFLTRNVVGRRLKPPPVAVSFDNAKFDPHLTMREKVTELTRDRACMTCHKVINPLGFVLEGYDAVGRWRTEENDKPIDTRSKYVTHDGKALDLTTAVDLARYAATSPVAHRAFVRQLFQHMIKQSPEAYGPHTADALRERFVAGEFSIQRLMVEIATMAAMHDESGTANHANSRE